MNNRTSITNPAPNYMLPNALQRPRRFLPQIELPSCNLGHAPFRLKCDAADVYWGHISLMWSSLESYMRSPNEFFEVLNEAVEMKNSLHNGTFKIPSKWKMDGFYGYDIYSGLIYPTEKGAWEKVDNTSLYLTIARQNLRTYESDSASHYIRMDVHEQKLRNATSDLEKIVLQSVKQGHSDLRSIIAEEVHTGVAKGIEAAIAKGTATLQQIGSERERLEKQRTELDKKIERLRLAEEKEQQRQAQKEANRKVKTKAGYVYLVKSPTGAYKIGRTSNPNDRMKTFTVKLPFEVEYIHLIHTSDMYTLEMQLHTHYQSQRIDGEWFALTDADVQEFCSIVGDVKE